ncbi:glycosyltransferase family 2 protein [Paenibacillus hexagrammi]|uniref:Glycosyltransferase family 2 protein n=1 Tax=Paenibacillus hexagrammi TaxID=2908839 RepID=A0ABY3SDM4_9BACL|nr:glycosyltransferase family 2 protein [Paenibacillus sp. YPD9-1]UJF32088.1 glycosyltransferase family 2 protein [Paenibacillus sp. YPD9-1]
MQRKKRRIVRRVVPLLPAAVTMEPPQPQAETEQPAHGPEPAEAALPYTVVVGYVNRPDLLRQALNSIEPMWPITTVIDNSNKVNLTDNPIGLPVRVYQPPDPLSMSQTVNLMHRLAAENGSEAAIFLHNDAELHPGAADQLLQTLEDWKQSGRRWGILKAGGSSLIAFHMEAVRAIGPMDTTLPHDYAQQDYDKRMSLLGYDVVEHELPVTHHNGGGSTYKDDGDLNHIRELMRPFYRNYYVDKWGGPPGEEKHSLLFGEFPLNPNPDYLKRFM